MKYIVNVKTIRDVLLTFRNVEGYKTEGGFIIFIDAMTKKTMRFPVSNCEIVEEVNSQ